jgi:hypothetical protein
MATSSTEHRFERTLPKDAHRVFQQVRNLTFAEKSCFVLAKNGRDVARQNGGSRNLRMKEVKASKKKKGTRTVFLDGEAVGS